MTDKPGPELKYPTPEDFETAVGKYFADCKADDVYPTFVGLATELGMSTRALQDYAHREGYGLTYTLAKQRMEAGVVGKMLAGKTPTAAGIFVLTQNFHGWVNPQRMEHSGPGGGPVAVAQAKPMPAEVKNEIDAHLAGLPGDHA